VLIARSVLGAGRIRAECSNPDGIRKMVQGDHRTDARLEERVDEVAISLELIFIDHVPLGLDLRPLDAEAVRVEPHLFHELDIARREACSTHRIPHMRLALAHSALFDGEGPKMPIGALILIFDLSRRGGSAETEAAPTFFGGKRTEIAKDDVF